MANIRQRSLVIPREHGAWGILLVPLVTGACVALTDATGAIGLLPLSILALALFWLRTPVESWAGAGVIQARTHDELRLVRTVSAALAAVAILAGVWLFWGGQNRELIGIGLMAAVAFLLQAGLKRVWRSAKTAAQIIGSAGLTATAPAAYYVVSSELGTLAWSLWAANFLFAGNQIHYVHLRIGSAKAATRREKLAAGRWFLLGQIVLIGLLCAACRARTFSWYAALAFLPVLVRGFAWFVAPPQPLAVHRLGKSELFLAIAFGVLLIAGFRI